MSDYLKHDTAIKAFIKNNPGASPTSNVGLKLDMVKCGVKPDRYGDVDWAASRVIDRRLQALKKAGAIRFNAKTRSWEIA